MNSCLPRIIPRSDHPLSRRSFSPNALRVLYRLNDNGFIAYLVGGCVRDLWLGREPKDFDVVTDATPGQIKRLFRNCRLIGRRFRLAHLHFSDEIIEVATFRSQEPEEQEDQLPGPDQPPTAKRHLKDEAGMLLRDNVFGSPAEDARRRDFTVNALSYNIADFSVIDHVSGLEDLERGLIRTIGDPVERFVEDPVRMLRAVRFAATLGFSIEEDTWKALVQLAPSITRSSPFRLYEEMFKLFLSGQGERCYQLLRQAGLFAPLFPRFSDWLAVETEGFPHVRVSQALDRVDALIQRGEKVEPQLLLALMFGQFLEEKAGRFMGEGLPAHQALHAAAAEFGAELAPTVMIPHKMLVAVREIIGYQHRLKKIPGRNSRKFAERPGFQLALDYLRVTSEMSGEGGDVVEWWDNLAVAPGSGSGETVPEPLVGKKRRRRRRSRKRRGKGGDSPRGTSGETTLF